MLWKSYFLKQNNLPDEEIALLMLCDYCSIDQWSHWLFVPCSIFLYHENRLCKFTFIITDICITLEERYCFSNINIYFFLCSSLAWSYFFSNWMEISVYTISFFIIWYGEHTWIPLMSSQYFSKAGPRLFSFITSPTSREIGILGKVMPTLPSPNPLLS